jgi:hypothetical protein
VKKLTALGFMVVALGLFAGGCGDRLEAARQVGYEEGFELGKEEGGAQALLCVRGRNGSADDAAYACEEPGRTNSPNCGVGVASLPAQCSV